MGCGSEIEGEEEVVDSLSSKSSESSDLVMVRIGRRPGDWLDLGKSMEDSKEEKLS